MVLHNRPTLSIGTERLACLNSPPGMQLGTLAWHAAGLGFRPVARIDFGGVAPPKNVDLLDPKSGLFEPHPLTLLQKPHFWPILWIKVDLLARFGGCIAPRTPPPPGYGPARVRAPCPAGALRTLFSPPSLPSSFGR